MATIIANVTATHPAYGTADVEFFSNLGQESNPVGKAIVGVSPKGVRILPDTADEGLQEYFETARESIEELCGDDEDRAEAIFDALYDKFLTAAAKAALSVL